jgi:hypothetical protein
MGDAENPNQTTPNPNPNPPVPPPVVTPENQGILRQAEAERGKAEVGNGKKIAKETRTIEWLQFGVNAVLAVLGGVAIFIYLGQLCEMRKQSKAATESVTEIQRQTRLSERPWLKLKFAGEEKTAEVHPTVKIAEGQPILVPMEFFNFGKTSALKIRAAIFLQIVDSGQEPDLPTNKQGIDLPGQPLPPNTHFIKSLVGQEFEAGVIYPNEHSDFPVSRVKKGTGTMVIPDVMLKDEVLKIGSGALLCRYLGHGLVLGHIRN